MTGQNLRSGMTRSCGCLHKESATRNIGNAYVARPRKPREFYRYTTKAGYVCVGNVDYPGAKPQPNHAYEHIVVMSRRLGRALLPGETVHHKNGNRADNREENLELWVGTHPAGQRVEDVVAWAQQVLRTYRPEMIKC